MTGQLLRLNGQTKAEEIISLSKLNANTIRCSFYRRNPERCPLTRDPVSIGGQSWFIN